MLTAGIIAEYNPFHNGHRYHIEATRAAGATHIVAVMSGDFVQRGEAAVMSKQARAEMALRGGADLVLLLPLPWAVATAQQFALGAVSLLDSLGCVDMLSFGSECGSVAALSAAASAVDDPCVTAKMRELMDGGVTFAAAREAAVRGLLPDAANVLASPNDTLAVEYIRSLNLLSSPIAPLAVKRSGAAHDSDLADGKIASASYIRSLILSGDEAAAGRFLPPESAAILRRETAAGYAPATLASAEQAVLARLRTMTEHDFAQLFDVSEGLENRLYSAVRNSTTLDEIYSAAKSKRYTHARIRRLVLAAFLGVGREAYSGGVPYLRVLGMNGRGREILAAAKKSAKIPVITRTKDAFALDKHGQNMFNLECRATDLFALMSPRRKPCGTEQTANILTF